MFTFCDAEICQNVEFRQFCNRYLANLHILMVAFKVKVEKHVGYKLPLRLSPHTRSDSVGCASDWRPGGRGFDPRRGLYAKIGLKSLHEYSADDINRRHFQMRVFLAF